MKYTFKEILASYTPEKRRNTSIWAKIFSRPLSFLTTYIFINMGFSANTVSIISMFEALIACALLMLGEPFTIWGVFLFLFWDVLDCTDGNIARVKKTSSPIGVFFDAMAGYTAVAFVFLAVGVAAFRTSNHFGVESFWFIIIGAVTSIFDLLARLVYQKYQVTEYLVGKVEKDGVFAKRLDGGIYRILNLIMKNLTFSSLFMPLLVLAYFLSKFDFLILFYSLYSVGFFIVSVIMFSLEAMKLNKDIK